MTALSVLLDDWKHRGARGRLFLLGAGFVALYVAVDTVTYIFPSEPFAATPWNPQPALALALIVLGGAAFAPAVLAAAVLAETVVREAPGGGFGFIVASGGMGLAYVLTGLAVRSRTRFAGGALTLRDLTWFVAFVVAGAVSSSIVYVGAYLLDGTLPQEHATRVFLRLAVGDVLGLVGVTPLLVHLARATPLPAGDAQRRAALRDLAVFILALVPTLLLVFAIEPFDEFRMSYLLFLPMIAFALRQGAAGAALAVPLAQLGVIISLYVLGERAATAFEFQMLLLALSLTTLYFGALAEERAYAAAQLAQREQQLREQQARLNQAQRMAAAAELAASLAHELNQPLSAIGTYASACRMLAAGGDTSRRELQDALTQVVRESARAGEFVRHMREFFRTGAADLVRTEPAALIDAAHDQVRDRLDRHGVRWTSRIEPGLPAVVVDRVQIGAVLGNLLANAIEAVVTVDPPRAIEVRALRSGDGQVRIEVEDSGPGVALEVRDRLFQPMATSKPGGMGLGLAMARTIAQRHGGSLWFDASRSKTTFCLELPADDR
ncbi:MAG: ATP-binding protein [Burkholderiaceae bacterium]